MHLTPWACIRQCYQCSTSHGEMHSSRDCQGCCPSKAEDIIDKGHIAETRSDFSLSKSNFYTKLLDTPKYKIFIHFVARNGKKWKIYVGLQLILANEGSVFDVFDCNWHHAFSSAQ